MRNGLHRHYGRLSGEERFRLDVLAMARGDAQESERLVGSCPKFSYTMNDRDFTGRWLGVLDMTLRVYLEVTAHLERLAMVGVAREMLPYQDTYARDRMRDAFVEGHKAGARQAWEAAEGEGSAPEWPLEGVDEAEVGRLAELGSSIRPEILDGLERLTAEHALTAWRAFGAFCDGTLGLDASKVLTVVLEPAVGCIDGLEARAERLGLEPDAERVEAIRETLKEAWMSVEDRGF